MKKALFSDNNIYSSSTNISSATSQRLATLSLSSSVGDMISTDTWKPDKVAIAKKVYILYTGGTMGMNIDANGLLKPEKGFLPGLLEKMDELSNPGMPEWELFEFDQLLDSAQNSIPDILRIAKKIEENYHDYDGFVIIHGTDTMAHTASALSFLFENLDKTVIVTGSMIPFFEVYNDARRNLIMSIIIASESLFPEVLIYFADKLYRGNRCVKRSPNELDAFDSPSFPPLALIGVDIAYRLDLALEKPTMPFHCRNFLDPRILIIRLMPGTDYTPFIFMLDQLPKVNWEREIARSKTPSFDLETQNRAIFNKQQSLNSVLEDNTDYIMGDDIKDDSDLKKKISETNLERYNSDKAMIPLKAIILESYGNGNVPNSESFNEMLRKAFHNDILVVISSQCYQSRISIGKYEASQILRDYNALSGEEMTVETIYMKLAYLLACGYNNGEIREYFPISIRGECASTNMTVRPVLKKPKIILTMQERRKLFQKKRRHSIK